MRVSTTLFVAQPTTVQHSNTMLKAAALRGRGFPIFINLPCPQHQRSHNYTSPMEDQKPVYLTEEGLEELKEELHHLRTHERSRVADAIAEARAKGDLSENAEYDAAKEEQGHLETRISKLEDMIARARLVDENEVDHSKAYILSTVRVKNLDNDAEQSFTLVSERESDPSAGKISVDSPVGQGLLGKEEGDVVEIDVPAGTVEMKILDISRGEA